MYFTFVIVYIAVLSPDLAELVLLDFEISPVFATDVDVKLRYMHL